jgi:hypothetical protein
MIFPDNVGNPRPPGGLSPSRVIMLSSSNGIINIDVEVWDRDDAPGVDDRLDIAEGAPRLCASRMI